jgi:integrase
MKRLTTAIIRDTQDPGTLWDGAARGLGLRIYKGGTKSFVFRYRNLDGVEHQIKIGRFGEWSLEAARERAKELRREVDRGGDPADDRRERREAATVADLVDRYVREHLPTRDAKNRRLPYMARHVRYRETAVRKMLDDIARHLGRHTKVADVHGGDIQAMHRALTRDRGPVMANRMLGHASKMFALSFMPLAGEDKPWRNAEQGNPCKGVQRNHEEGRTRFYSEAELTRIAAALHEYELEVRDGANAVDAVRLVMLTGCRPQVARVAKWSEFDGGYWTRPSAHVKTRRELRVPLSPGAVELIERLRRKRKPGQEWVFPGQRRGEPLQTIEWVWRFVRERAGLAPSDRMYDLRHSYASIGAGGGLSLPIIGALLGHASVRTTQRYAHLSDHPLREAADRIGAVIDGATANGNGNGAEVLRISRKG